MSGYAHHHGAHAGTPANDARPRAPEQPPSSCINCILHSRNTKEAELKRECPNESNPAQIMHNATPMRLCQLLHTQSLQRRRRARPHRLYLSGIGKPRFLHAETTYAIALASAFFCPLAPVYGKRLD